MNHVLNEDVLKINSYVKYQEAVKNSQFRCSHIRIFVDVSKFSIVNIITAKKQSKQIKYVINIRDISITQQLRYKRRSGFQTYVCPLKSFLLLNLKKITFELYLNLFIFQKKPVTSLS